MTAWVIIDTGPLVAYLQSDEAPHTWSTEQFRAADEPFVTCESVVTEALFLLQRERIGSQRLFALFDRDIIRIAFSLGENLAEVRRLMSDYADLPMSLADACLVRMAELNPRAEIITLDHHFKFYRAQDRRMLTLRLPPTTGR